ncbi:MAG: hypothetical protein WD035_11300 [Balneolaceae bacterium]
MNFILVRPSLGQSIPSVYLDCSGYCYGSYIRTNIEFVNYVRDQEDADIYLRITNASTGTGREYVMDFRGIEPFSARRDTLVYHSLNTDSSDERRLGLVRRLKLGLTPFLTNTDLAGDLTVLYEPSGEPVNENQEDPWNSWVFDIRLGSTVDVEETESNFGLDSRISAERITHDWKIRSSVEGRPNRRTIELSEGTRHVNRDRAEFDGSVVYGIGNHFAVGVFSSFDYSRRENTRYEFQASPAFEYSVYPYSDFQERRIFIQYRVTPSYREYAETTIFQKDSETLLQQVLSTRVRYDQPWGRIDIRLWASNYFHDFAINRVSINPSLNIRITRNLSFNIYARYRAINDQISLPAGDPDDIDLLLGQREQATSYDFRVSFGFSYTFGSIFSGAVNPRL